VSTLKLFAAAILASVVATAALAEAVICDPASCAQYYPNANCQNQGSNNPYTDPNWRRDGGGWSSGQVVPDSTVGVVRKRAPRHRPQS
jgi:hypothetical protein